MGEQAPQCLAQVPEVGEHRGTTRAHVSSPRPSVSLTKVQKAPVPQATEDCAPNPILFLNTDPTPQELKIFSPDLHQLSKGSKEISALAQKEST